MSERFCGIGDPIAGRCGRWEPRKPPRPNEDAGDTRKIGSGGKAAVGMGGFRVFRRTRGGAPEFLCQPYGWT